jgi:hypothetical protein
MRWKLSRDSEVWGLRFELFGLLVVVAATFWQAVLTDWWDLQLREGQAWIQEDVNIAELESIRNLADLAATDDAALRQRIATSISNTTSKAISDAIGKRKERAKAISQGQPELFASIRTWLLVLGAAFLAIGKWMTLQGVHVRTSIGRKRPP